MPNRIRELRERANLSLAQVAVAVFGNEIDVKSASSQIAKIEREETSLTLLWMQRLAKPLGVTPADLLSDSDNPSRVEPEESALVSQLRAMPAELRAKAVEIVAVLARPMQAA